MARESWLSDEFISKNLAKLNSFVNWDRWIDCGNRGKIFYGWIKRNDSHEDFIAVTFSEKEFYYISSSSKYSAKISEILFGKKTSNHKDCERIENLSFADKLNCIKL